MEDRARASQPEAARMVRVLTIDTSVFGVATLGDKLFVLRKKSNDPRCQECKLEVYDLTNYQMKYELSMPTSGMPTQNYMSDMAACEHHGCLYISDYVSKCVRRMDVNGHTKPSWPVTDTPTSLSVTIDHNVLVTFLHSNTPRESPKDFWEFPEEGDSVIKIKVQASVGNPYHAIKLTNGLYATCHGDCGNDHRHGVCVVDRDGKILQHHGGYDDTVGFEPCRLAADEKGYIFVMEVKGRRILKLTPTLQFVCYVTAPGQLEEKSWNMCYDVRMRRLHVVTENRLEDPNQAHQYIQKPGTIVVFDV